MKASTLQNRLDKRYTGSKATKAYQMVSDMINQTNKTYAVRGAIIRPCYASGSGRFTSNQDHTSAVVNILNLLGIKYQSGNDAPKGGLTGNFIKILTKIEY